VNCPVKNNQPRVLVQKITSYIPVNKGQKVLKIKNLTNTFFISPLGVQNDLPEACIH